MNAYLYRALLLFSGILLNLSFAFGQSVPVKCDCVIENEPRQQQNEAEETTEEEEVKEINLYDDIYAPPQKQEDYPSNESYERQVYEEMLETFPYEEWYPPQEVEVLEAD